MEYFTLVFDMEYNLYPYLHYLNYTVRYIALTTLCIFITNAMHYQTRHCIYFSELYYTFDA